VVKSIKSGISLAAIALAVAAGSGLAAADTPPAPAAAGSTLEQRIAQRKAERGTALSTIDQKRVISTCRAAQTKIRAVQTAEVSMLDNRSQVYGAIDAKLWIVTGQLKLAKQDTFQLEKQRLILLDKSNNFQTVATNYKQALDDSLLINCQADPNGFKALVDTARIYNDQLRTQSADSHNFVVNTVKSTLGDFVTKLQPKSPDQGTP
jgi:hypothetical protein